MPTFITLIELDAEREAETLENITAEFEEAVGLAESQGGEVKATYHGDIAGYDVMTISEFPDRESIEKTDILYSMDPAVSTDVVRVHSHEEYAELVAEALHDAE